MDNIQPTNQNSKSSNFFRYVFFVLLLLIFIGLGVCGGFWYAKTKTICAQKACAPCPKTSSEDLGGFETPLSNWKTGKFAGIFSYEYPLGWNVLELWGEDPVKNGMTLAIDPDPISTAPRGGPLATFTVWISNQDTNPLKTIQNKMAGFNDQNYTDIIKEEISTEDAKIYHTTAKVAGEMYQGEPVESYMFVLGQYAVIAEFSFSNDKELSEMFRHVVLSIKPLH